MSILMDAPVRAPPTSVATISRSSLIQPSLVPNTTNHLSLMEIRGIIPPPTSLSASTIPTSSLPAQAAFVASLAQIPPNRLEVRKHTDPFRPIMETTAHSYVYVNSKNKGTQLPGEQVSDYVLRPNFRDLYQSDDPANHKSLHYITSLPSSYQPPPLSPKGVGIGSGGHRRRSSNGAAVGSSNSCLYFVRAPRKPQEVEQARIAQEQKEARDDYESGGLKPRPIKSVAAILSGGAGPGITPKKPRHLRMGSMRDLAAAAVAQHRAGATSEDDLSIGVGRTGSLPRTGSAAGSSVAAAFLASPKGGASLARFARGLKLPNKSSAGPVSNLPPGEVDSDDEKEASLAATSGTEQDSSLKKHLSKASSTAAELTLPEPIPEPSFTPITDAASPGIGKESVVVAAEQGAACCICSSSDFVEPWISQCQHICCSECWMTWLNENTDKQCPECDAPISLEELRPISLCLICNKIPTKPWTAQCRHTCCRECWNVYLTENPACPECQAPVNKDQLPQ